jgi:hypothetical protein
MRLKPVTKSSFESDTCKQNTPSSNPVSSILTNILSGEASYKKQRRVRPIKLHFYTVTLLRFCIVTLLRLLLFVLLHFIKRLSCYGV